MAGPRDTIEYEHDATDGGISHETHERDDDGGEHVTLSRESDHSRCSWDTDADGNYVTGSGHNTDSDGNHIDWDDGRDASDSRD